jgi:hypothetical protein
LRRARLALACLPALSQALLPQAVRLFLAGACAGAGVHHAPGVAAARATQRTAPRPGIERAPRGPARDRSSLLLQADEVAVLPAGHPLLERRTLKPRDFAALPFISFAPAQTLIGRSSTPCSISTTWRAG